jgi:hypothetical protein
MTSQTNGDRQPGHAPAKPSSWTAHFWRWAIPAGAILTLCGFFGPWVNHRVAGLVILGLDLGEYVKFLPPVRSGEIALWREGFYLPPVAVSLSLSLVLFRRELRLHWAVRALLVAAAIVAALNLLPPAWTPPRMLTPEFRLQAAGIGLCLLAVALSPLLALLPRRVTSALIALLALASLLPFWQFARVLPPIAELYNQPLTPGWGIYVMALGLAVLLAGAYGLWAGRGMVATSKPVNERTSA